MSKHKLEGESPVRKRFTLWRSVEVYRIVSFLTVVAAPAVGFAISRTKHDYALGGLLALQLGIAAVTWYLGDARAKRIEKERIEAVLETLVSLSDVLEPTVESLSAFVGMPVAARRHNRSGMVEAVVSAAVGLAPGESRPRASYFKLNASGDCMTHEISRGRAVKAKARFMAGTAVGDSALELIRSNEFMFCDDVNESPPPGWVQSQRGEYQTFVSVPVQAGGRPFGMLTLDATEIGSLTREDGQVLRVLGHILGIVECMSA